MCSKSHEQQPPVLEEEEEEVEEEYQDFQNYTARFEEQIGMGINNDYYSYTSISPMLHPQQQQPSWMDVANAGSSGDNMMMSSSYLFPPPVPPPLIMSSSGNLFNRPGGLYEGTAYMPFGLQAEMGKILTPQEIMDAKALAASKSHSEAERRRRERINNHLVKLRSLLPSTTKTDKASLLAEVIQHVKELKRQTSIIAEQSPVPTESDELTIDKTSDEQGNIIIRASLCCEDRSDLLPDLIKTLKALRLRTLKAEITTLGGRMKNVLFITGDHQDDSSCSIQQAFKAVMDKTNDNNQSSSGSTSSHVKRQRTNNIVNNVLNS